LEHDFLKKVNAFLKFEALQILARCSVVQKVLTSAARRDTAMGKFGRSFWKLTTAEVSFFCWRIGS
jgi:hypothetical protein